MLIDTHAHLNFPDFAADLPALLERATAAGVDRAIIIGTTVEGSREAVALTEQHPSLFATVGIHPNAAKDAGPGFIDQLRQLAQSPKVVGIGEIGLDYYRLPALTADAADTQAAAGVSSEALAAIKAQQADVFRQQLDLAVELGLNVVIHERDAWDDTVAILQPYSGKLRAVFHCFGKSLEHAQTLLADNHLVSFTGIVTFKNATILQHTAKHLPDNTFMVETDCPFLAPVPHRGKRAEPAHVRIVAEHLAGLRGTTWEKIAKQTTATAEQFFRFRADAKAPAPPSTSQCIES